VTAFLAELAEFQKQNQRFELTMTDREGIDWDWWDWGGEREYITREMIEKHVGDVTAPVYYVAGPPAMVSAVETLLSDAGVKNENVRAEAFSGY